MSTGRNSGSGAFQFAAGVVCSVIVAAFTFPLVFEQIEAVDVSGYSGGFAAVWGMFPEVMILTVVLGVVGTALRYS